MQEIIKWVERLVADELERANDEFPLFHSKHEAYGVLLEEFIEAHDEWENFVNVISDTGNCAFKDRDEELKHNRMYARQYAMYCIAELIQCVAMLDKWTQSEDKWNEV